MQSRGAYGPTNGNQRRQLVEMKVDFLVEKRVDLPWWAYNNP
jgi:hypothetical protein